MRGRVPWRLAAIPLLVAIGLGVTSQSQGAIDAKRQRSFDEELLYLPNDKLLTHFNAGMSSIVADMLWLKCIQYTSKHFKEDRKFEWLNHMCQTITRLDPHFVDAYHYGSIFLAGLDADDDASLALLDRGIVHNPDRWELPYDAAMVYLLNRREEPDSPERAARYLAMAVATGTAPESVIAVAEGLKTKYDLVDIERGMWEELARSDDELTRSMAARKLIELQLRVNCKDLTRAVQLYATRKGSAPSEIRELVSEGIIAAIPDDPLGGRYFIESTGNVNSTTLLDEAKARRLRMIAAAIKKFHTQQGRFPVSLDELVDLEFLHRLPKHPYVDGVWHYDPATGAAQ